tara:strand:- start:211 stop:642 length:432 start_codon:yes stop_codon:yes gene_type:complete
MDKLEQITHRITTRVVAVIGLLFGIFFAILASSADDKPDKPFTVWAYSAPDKPIDPDMEVKVNGLVCASCAIGIKRKLKPEVNIKSLAFDTKKQLLLIDFIKIKGRVQWLRNDRIILLVKNAGYEVTSIKRLDNIRPNRYNQP